MGEDSGRKRGTEHSQMPDRLPTLGRGWTRQPYDSFRRTLPVGIPKYMHQVFPQRRGGPA